MHRTYNTALVLVRCFGLGAIIMGLMWLVNLVAATVLVALHAREWLVTLIWSNGGRRCKNNL